MRWLKTHSDAARSHAAYWSGPAKRRLQVGKESKKKKDHASVLGTCADERPYVHAANVDLPSSATRAHKFYASTTLVDIINLPPRGNYLTPRQIDAVNSRCRQTLVSDLNEMNSFPVDLTVLEFYSEDFLRKFVMVGNEDSALMFTSCLLLGYAHHIALTGQGDRMALLELKSQVIRYLTAKMEISDALLSPRCLIAILTLGAPIVCLVSRDLPAGLSIREYISKMLEEDHLCDDESAVIARMSLNEQVVHRQALRRLFLKTRTYFQDTESIALLQYISNYMNMCVYVKFSIYRLRSNKFDRSIAVEAADYLHSPPSETEKLFPVTSSCHEYTVPEQWASPLTCQWVEKIPAAYIETQMLLLTGLVHKWLATFLDENNRLLAQTNELLQNRADLRRDIESFAPATMNSNVKEEAMYECCRRVTSLLLAAEKLHIPIHAAARHVESGLKLTKLFRQTDLANLWGRHRGLLLWVAATCQFATASRCFPLLCTTLLAQLVQELSMSNIHSEITTRSLKRLKQFESLCCCQAPILNCRR